MGGYSDEEVIANPERLLGSEAFKRFLPPLKRAYVASEVTLAAAGSKERSDAATAGSIDAARFALEGMLSPECAHGVNLLCDNLKIFYLHALAKLLARLEQNGWRPLTCPKNRCSVMVEAASRFEDLRSSDSVEPSAHVSFTGLANRHVRYGFGLPLTACRKKDPNRAEDRYLPETGTCVPVTAVLDVPESCDERPCNIIVKLHNAFTTETVEVRKKTFPLAANFSAPFASLVEKTGLTDFSGMLSAFEGSEQLLRNTGFYTAEPYDSGKIPLITVHGLFSSPITWISLQNDLLGDPKIRNHFQIWNYLYPTNLPIIENAKTFRTKLDELESHLTASSPERKGLRDMVIIAHSMGGLLTKTAVAKDSAPISDFFIGSPEKLAALDAETRASFDGYLNFSCRPYIARAIFVSVPFRGSDVSDTWVGWLGRLLISIPKKVLQAPVSLVQKTRDLLRPEFASELDDQDYTSIKGLSPKNPMLAALDLVHVDQHVPFHLIEGDRGLGGGPDASDGVVSHKSSYLAGAESELIVPADHAAHAHPLAVQEIKRILYLHLARMEHEGKPAPTTKKLPSPLHG